MIILLIVLVVLIGFVIVGYNRMVTLRNRVDNAWSQIDVQLRRRYDLIPNLVKTVQGYAEHEKGVFEEVTKARSQAVSAGSVGEQAKAENFLSQTLRSLFAVAEAYPDLKASTNFMQLQEELSGTESKIAFARQFYNDTTLKFNTAIQVFPWLVLANLFSFNEREYFEIVDLAREPVEVDFSK